MKGKPIKNYIILMVIILAVVIFVFYVRGWYNTSKIYYSQNSIVKEVTREINYDEIFNYTLESQNFILYVSSGSNIEIKDFENDFKKLILKLDIGEDILYLNLDNVDISLFNNNLKNDFASNDHIKSRISDNSPVTLYVFENGKIISVLNNVNSYSTHHLKSLLEKWGFNND